MEKILLCWIGATDLKASKNTEEVGFGPIAQAVQAEEYREVALLSDYDKGKVRQYVSWLNTLTDTKITVGQVSLSSPTDFGDIYKAASSHITNKLEEFGEDAQLVFHLSPGTPAMAAVWILLAKTNFPAELIESSKQQGVKKVSIPFDISADYFPNYYKGSDQALEKLAFGLTEKAPEFDDIVHRSEVMRRVVLKSRVIASRSIPVLIEGESGTGKELFARAIHDASPRKKKPFVAINCGAIPAELVEAELFGHEKGAFTDAKNAKAGHFEVAHQGTIFLDEVGELPKEMQVKLLRTLQEGEVRRIGANKPLKVDVRIIAATNRNLIDEVGEGTFREDLFYRLAVAVIKLPPLRERTGDVSLLLDTFLGKINQESRAEINHRDKKISVSARNLLLNHTWPGNVRELQNTLMRAVVWALEDELTAQDIQEALLPIPSNNKSGDAILNKPLEQGFDIQEIMKRVAVHYLERALAENHGNKTKAAKMLGLPSYQTLTNWLKKYGLE